MPHASLASSAGAHRGPRASTSYRRRLAALAGLGALLALAWLYGSDRATPAAIPLAAGLPASPAPAPATPPQPPAAQRTWQPASPEADLKARIDALAAQARDRGASVRGTDADHDGVRDDIQRYIDQHWPEPTVHAAMQHYAARQQALLETASRSQARTEMGRMLRSLECLGRLSGNDGLMRSKDVLAMNLNTPQRRQAYDRAMARVAGALFFETAGDPCA